MEPRSLYYYPTIRWFSWIDVHCCMHWTHFVVNLLNSFAACAWCHQNSISHHFLKLGRLYLRFDNSSHRKEPDLRNRFICIWIVLLLNLLFPIKSRSIKLCNTFHTHRQYFRVTVLRINKSAHNLCSICIYNLVRIRSNTIDSKCTPFNLYDKFGSIVCKIRLSIFSLLFRRHIFGINRISHGHRIGQRQLVVPDKMDRAYCRRIKRFGCLNNE